MPYLCMACGKPIYSRRAQGIGITLLREWRHTSWLANRTHRVILPPELQEDSDDD